MWQKLCYIDVCMPSSHSCIPLSLNHKSDFGGLKFEKWWNKIRSEVYSCLFRALSTYEKMIASRVLLELRCYSDLSQHIKEPQNSIYCLNFFKNDKIWKLRVLRPCFIPEAACSVFSVSVLSVSSLLCDVFFTAWEHDVCCESSIVCGR